MLGHLASFRSLESTSVMFMQTLKGNTKLASRLNSREDRVWEMGGKRGIGGRSGKCRGQEF